MSLTQFDASSLTPAVVILLTFFARLIVLIISLPDKEVTPQPEVMTAIKPSKIIFFTIPPSMQDCPFAFPVR